MQQTAATSPAHHHPISRLPLERQRVLQGPASESGIIGHHGTIIIEVAAVVAVGNTIVVVVVVAVAIGRGGSMDLVVDMSGYFSV
jgi:hypothetical protein